MQFGPPQIHFPEDEGVHPASLIEWWYGNFRLTDSEGKEHAAMVAYFNFGLKIIAFFDLEAGSFYHKVFGSSPHFAQGILDLRWGGRDHWFRTDPDSLSYRLESYHNEIGLNLDIRALKPPLLAGGDGLVKWSGGVSHYYSLTRLQVDGQVKLSERTIDVKGIGWMDHQWMNAIFNCGWDWFSVQLGNNTEILVWQLVNPDESIESMNMTIMFPDNSVYHTQKPTLERLDSWVSPKRGNEYGVLWRVREETKALDLEIRACYIEQEIRMLEALSIAPFYFWEGSTTVSGHLAGEAVSGIGHAELVRPPPQYQMSPRSLSVDGGGR